MSDEAATDAHSPYCDHCGDQRLAANHSICQAQRTLEPPRYCTACGRRLIVQVMPAGWTARCSRHGAVKTNG